MIVINCIFLIGLVHLVDCEPGLEPDVQEFSGYRPVKTEVHTTYYEPDTSPVYSSSNSHDSSHYENVLPQKTDYIQQQQQSYRQSPIIEQNAAYAYPPPNYRDQQSVNYRDNNEQLNLNQFQQNSRKQQQQQSNQQSPIIEQNSAYAYAPSDYNNQQSGKYRHNNEQLYLNQIQQGAHKLQIPQQQQYQQQVFQQQYEIPAKTYTEQVNYPAYSTSSTITSGQSVARNQDDVNNKRNSYHDVATEKFNVLDEHHHNDMDVRSEQAIRALRELLVRDISAQGDFFNAMDIEDLMHGPGRLLQRYLIQRDFDIPKTRDLIINVLAWRKKMAINQLDGREIACELFRLGFIFEQKSAQTGRESANPVIWIRLGALGEAVKAIKSRRHSSPIKALTSDVKMVKTTARKIFDGAARRGPSKRLARMVASGDGGAQIKDDSTDPRSLANDATLQLLLRSIAWWINDWDQHHPLSKATLLLDFEESDTVFSSSSIGSFLIQLDDRFPDLFEKIIAFRYATPATCFLKNQVSYLNRVFLSRVAASDKTFKKISFIGHKDEVQKYISDQRVKGANDIPEHVLKTCTHRSYPLPQSCSAPSSPYSNAYGSVANIDQSVISMIKTQLEKC